MNILLLGSGAREHALALKISASPLCSKLFIAPGNGGTASCGENVSINENDFDSLGKFALTNKVDMIICGPEAPLVQGAYDYFTAINIPFLGPSKNGAQLEGSKAFSKKFMMRHGIPTASYFEADEKNIEEAFEHLQKGDAPYVLKADGLAAGKGVLIIQSLEGAKHELRLMIEENKFGDAGKKVVIEEFLSGIEFSVFVLTDGKNYVLLPEAKDYKRIGEGDTGLNTGGMGAVSPVPFVTAEILREVDEKIIKPTINGLHNEKIIYQGFIFFGLIKTEKGIYVIEYNARLGDPETEAILPRLENDIIELFIATYNRKLNEQTISISKKHAATVVLASKGYPESFEKGKEISNLIPADNTFVFHAGTKKEDEKILSNGGRVMAVTALANSLKEAVEMANAAAEYIQFENKYYRRDIGYEFK